MSALLFGEYRPGRWHQRICDACLPSPLGCLLSSGTCSAKRQCQPHCFCPGTFEDLPPAISAGIFSPPLSSAVSTDFRISDTMSSYLACSLLCWLYSSSTMAQITLHNRSREFNNSNSRGKEEINHRKKPKEMFPTMSFNIHRS